MNKNFVIALSLFLSLPIYGVITKLSGTEEILKKIEKMSTKFAETRSGASKGPELIKKDGRIFLAKMNSFALDLYYEFETQDEANSIQMNCHNGWSWSVAWYYCDSEQSKSTSRTDEKKETKL
jgi:hypothetical protein